MRSKKEKYYFKQEAYGSCREYCRVKNNGIMIGSVSCQQCKYCKDWGPRMNEIPLWIMCKRIDQAVENRIVPQTAKRTQLHKLRDWILSNSAWIAIILWIAFMIWAFTGCKKIEPGPFPDTCCAECQMTGKPTQDSCGVNSAVLSWMEKMRSKGYQCKTK